MENPVELSPQQIAALDRSITPPRMSTYGSAAAGDTRLARELYLWDRAVSVGFLADLAILEVALRNSMSTQLERKWGAEWYANTDIPLDDRSSSALNTAWRRVSGPKTPGKLVAQCTFGFWRGLLDKGDHAGREPRRVRCDYEVLWRGVLDKSFPGGREQARIDGKRWNREYALNVVSRINDLRNRVAHHEPLVNGFPLSGQRTRVSAQAVFDDFLRLAAMLDRDLHSLIEATSQVPRLLAARPGS